MGQKREERTERGRKRQRKEKGTNGNKKESVNAHVLTLPAALAACRMMGVAVERMVGGLLGGGGGAWGFAGVWEECRSAVWACAEAVAAVEAGAACRNTWCRMGVA